MLSTKDPRERRALLVLALCIAALFAWNGYLTYRVQTIKSEDTTNITIEGLQTTLKNVQLQTNANGQSMWVTFNGDQVLAYFQVIGGEYAMASIPLTANATALPDVFNTTQWANISVYTFVQPSNFVGCCNSPTFFLSTDYSLLCYYHADVPTAYDVNCATINAACRYVSQLEFITNHYTALGNSTKQSLASLFLSYDGTACS
jgi:hypothetical protein